MKSIPSGQIRANKKTHFSSYVSLVVLCNTIYLHYNFFTSSHKGSCLYRSVTEEYYQTDYFVQMLHALYFLYYKRNLGVGLFASVGAYK